MSEHIWSKADLHIHSAQSDGAADVRALLGYVAEHTDLGIVAVTDHDVIAGSHEAHRLAPAYGLGAVVGEEITTQRGHLLALFIREYIPPGLPLAETVERVHAQGGLAILAHPFERLCNSPLRHWPRPTDREWGSFGLDGLEALNGSQFGSVSNPRSLALGEALGLALTGGSDAHHLRAIGVAHTLFAGTSVADLRRSLEWGTCLPGGRRWSVREYAGWVARSFAPRAFRLPARASSILGLTL